MMTEKEEQKQHSCPFCDEEIRKAGYPFCQACGVEMLHCPQCRQPVSRDKKVCPNCGEEIKGK